MTSVMRSAWTGWIGTMPIGSENAAMAATQAAAIFFFICIKITLPLYWKSILPLYKERVNLQA